LLAAVQIDISKVLLDRYSPTPYHYATPIKCPPSPAPSQTPTPGRFLLFVKAHNKLPILAAYPYLSLTVISISVARCEIQICGYVGSLVWALTKGASDWEGAFDLGLVMRVTWPGVNDLPLAWCNGMAADYSDRTDAASKEHLIRRLIIFW